MRQGDQDRETKLHRFLHLQGGVLQVPQLYRRDLLNVIRRMLKQFVNKVKGRKTQAWGTSET
jgi:hypothetical protein